ncbi:MAG: undecaprenyl-diphosphate phosphatase [Clostridiaceae bacterium]|nr:undecaprenyl-diphosphate phosphatase [Clostridiaceae bacterium]
MSAWFAALMGIVQGLTEFLPISSSGHLVLLQNFLGADIEHDYVLFDVLLHFGTLISVFLCFWPDIRDMIVEFFRLLGDLFRGKPDLNKTPARRMMIMVVLATIPMVVVPLVDDRIEALFASPFLVGVMLFVTAIILYIVDRARNGKKTAATASWKDALIVGCLQLIALIPGISRSGTTIMGCSVRGFKRDFSVKFAFLMSIPVILGANIFTIKDALAEGIDTAMILPYIIGVLCAALAGIAAISMVRFIANRKSFRPFSIYCVCAGALAIVLSFVL